MSTFVRSFLKDAGRGLNRFALLVSQSSGYIFGGTAAFFSILLVQIHVYEISRSEGPSMYPTIPDRVNMLGVNKLYKNGRGIQIGDCINLSNPLFPKEYSGKRVIGLPGDYVLRSKAKSPTPGGAPMPGITDWSARAKGESEQEWEEPEMIQVPQGHVWVEGDNMAWSRDSRTYGPIPMALINGRSGWYKDGLFSGTSLAREKNVRKVEEWEMDSILGEAWMKSKEREHLMKR